MDCGIAVMAFLKREREMKKWQKPPWAASSSADVTSLRTWTSGDGWTQTYKTWAGQRQRGGGGNGNNKTNGQSLGAGHEKQTWRSQWTERSRGLDKRHKRENMSNKNYGHWSGGWTWKNRPREGMSKVLRGWTCGTEEKNGLMQAVAVDIDQRPGHGTNWKQARGHKTALTKLRDTGRQVKTKPAQSNQT